MKQSCVFYLPHYENMPIQIYTENFTTKKKKKMKIFR